jgi:transcription elongation GreA/GreB family factor
VFHRIWSTNWWRNHKNETKRLINFIEETCKTRENGSTSDKNLVKEAFTDIIVAKEDSLVDLKKEYQTEIQEFVELDEIPTEVNTKEERDQHIQKIFGRIQKEVQPIQRELFEDRVQLNSKVEIKYINIGKNLNVHLVDERIKKFTMNIDLQKIDVKSPLGVSLMGKCVGDTAQVGDLDNYVEVLTLENQ